MITRIVIDLLHIHFSVLFWCVFFFLLFFLLFTSFRCLFTFSSIWKSVCVFYFTRIHSSFDFRVDLRISATFAAKLDAHGEQRSCHRQSSRPTRCIMYHVKWLEAREWGKSSAYWNYVTRTHTHVHTVNGLWPRLRIQCNEECDAA